MFILLNPEKTKILMTCSTSHEAKEWLRVDVNNSIKPFFHREIFVGCGEIDKKYLDIKN